MRPAPASPVPPAPEARHTSDRRAPRTAARTAAAALLGSAAGRFLVVGAVATAVDIGLFNLLHVLAAVDPYLSKALSTVVAALVAFVGNRQWSFPDREDLQVVDQVLRYVVVNVIALGAALLPIAVARGLGLDGVVAMNVAANGVGLALATTLRFLGYRWWVFAAPSADPIAVSPPEPGPAAVAAR